MEARELAELALKEALRLGADEAAVQAVTSTSRQVRFANNEITVTKTWDSLSLGVYLVKDRKVVGTFLSNIDPEAVKSALRDLMSLLSVMRERPDYAPLPEGPFTYEPIPGLYDSELAGLGERAIDLVESAINKALEAGGRRVAGTFSFGEEELVLLTSRGVEAEHRKTRAELVVRALADGESAGVGTTCGTRLKDLDPELAGEEAGRFAKLSLNPEPLEPGRYDVVFGRPAAAVFFDIVAGMNSAFHVDSGLSCFAGKLGQKVASDIVSIYDDARLEAGLGSRAFDDEGLPTSRKPIIEGGVLKTHLHNSITAKRHNTRSTANAGWIVPRPWNVVVSTGQPSDEELMSEVERGLFVNNITYVRFQDYAKGDFSAVIRDGVFLLEKGEIKKAVKGLRLSDNVLNVLSSIKGLSREARQVFHWWMEWGSPAVITPLVLAEKIGFTVPTK
ncbi:TldD/PmbA family protein [Candidatus Bathyarchaeota archaeon]|nr:MAG: TldD/PmbA family protein [Candidatus Bathyarchaeota archaeon]